MPSRTPGPQPDPAAELLGRWQAHHEGHPGSEGPSACTPDDDTSGPATPPEATAPAAPTRAPRHAAPRTSLTSRPPSPRSDQTEAAREVIEALGISAPTPPDPEPEPVPVEPRPRAVAPPVAPRPSTDVEFAPRVLVRRVLGLLLLGLVPATIAAGYLAYDDPTTLTLGAAGTLLVLTLALYALRVSATPARLAIHGGQLEVVRGNQREVFDLTSRFTRMEVVGRPGRPGWKVLMARFGRDPLVIDSSMVDPAAFTAALERHRPQRS